MMSGRAVTSSQRYGNIMLMKSMDNTVDQIDPLPIPNIPSNLPLSSGSATECGTAVASVSPLSLS
jgi:hypothetical protein